jgi:methionyl-tRNA formyltransferase
MQFPESWLRAFCNPPLTTEQLAHTLTMAGLEVEDLQPVAPPFSHIMVGEIAIFATTSSVPGSFLSDGKNWLRVVCADGLLQVLDLQMEGKRRMTVRDFLNGYRM